MPTYVYRCTSPGCTERKEIICHSSDRNQIVKCPIHNPVTMKRDYTKEIKTIMPDIKPYFDMNLCNDAYRKDQYCTEDPKDHCPLGTLVKNNKHKRELMKRFNLEYDADTKRDRYAQRTRKRNKIHKFFVKESFVQTTANHEHDRAAVITG